MREINIALRGGGAGSGGGGGLRPWLQCNVLLKCPKTYGHNKSRYREKGKRFLTSRKPNSFLSFLRI